VSEENNSSQSAFPSKLGFGVGIVLLLVGISVFLIRFVHAGPYGMPAGGNLRAAVLCLVLASLLLRPERVLTSFTSALRWVALIAAPICLFFGLYATLAEVEEVIVVRATDSNGSAVNLRLWVVDLEDGAWVMMPHDKAAEHSLDGARLEMLRQGQTSCVSPQLSQDREKALAVLAVRNEKYAVQRLAMAVGIFGRELSDSVAVLRLAPCEGEELSARPAAHSALPFG